MLNPSKKHGTAIASFSWPAESTCCSVFGMDCALGFDRWGKYLAPSCVTHGGFGMAKPRVILWIDDDVLALEARKELLECSGYCALTAASGQEGLELFASHRIDAVILDYQMEMTGDRVASEMKRVKPRIPILMLSAYNELPRRMLTHVDAFLCKSDSWPRVLSVLDRLLPKRRSLFDRWCESWKGRHRNLGRNSLTGPDSEREHPPASGR